MDKYRDNIRDMMENLCRQSDEVSKLKKERDMAIQTIEWIVNEMDCPVSICKEICANHDGVCSKHAEIGRYDHCKGFKWKGV